MVISRIIINNRKRILFTKYKKIIKSSEKKGKLYELPWY